MFNHKVKKYGLVMLSSSFHEMDQDDGISNSELLFFKFSGIKHTIGTAEYPEKYSIPSQRLQSVV